MLVLIIEYILQRQILSQNLRFPKYLYISKYFAFFWRLSQRLLFTLNFLLLSAQRRFHYFAGTPRMILLHYEMLLLKVACMQTIIILEVSKWMDVLAATTSAVVSAIHKVFQIFIDPYLLSITDTLIIQIRF